MMTAVAEGRLSLERYVTISSAAPARAFGLYGRKGVIRPGADADIAIVDPERRQTLGAARLHSRGKVSAYEGMEVRGVPTMTFVRGRLVAKDGEVDGRAGLGTHGAAGDAAARAAQPSTPRCGRCSNRTRSPGADQHDRAAVDQEILSGDVARRRR